VREDEEPKRDGRWFLFLLGFRLDLLFTVGVDTLVFRFMG